jgi:predicted nucleotide-binding protein
LHGRRTRELWLIHSVYQEARRIGSGKFSQKMRRKTSLLYPCSLVEPVETSNLRRKRVNLSSLLGQLHKHDGVLEGLISRSQPWQGAPDSMMKVLRDLFRQVAELLPEKGISFDDNNDIDALRSQIITLYAKIHSGISSITESLDEIHPPQAVPTQAAQILHVVDPRKVFVVYGRNTAFRSAMFTFLRSISLEPMEWGQILRTASQASPFIGDALDSAFNQAKATVVLLSGDDVARLGTAFLQPNDGNDERNLTAQARPNVLFEAGMAFGRSPNNVVLVSIGYIRSFSDVAGRHILHLNDTVAARQELSERLEHAGCAVDTKGKNDWHTAGTFQAAIIEPDKLASAEPLLEVIRRRADPELGAGYKPKVWAEVRNNSDHCLEVQLLGWRQTSAGVKIKYGPNAMQLKIGHVWCPEKEGVETLYVGPTKRIQSWVQPDADPANASHMAELHRRCENTGQIGQLDLRVNGVRTVLEV